MAQNQVHTAQNNEAYEAKPQVSKRRLIFAKTFGIPGLIFGIISAWFTVAQSLVAMTAPDVAELIAKGLFASFSQFMNFPMLALCFFAVMWAGFSIALCALSRFLGTTLKINQAGFVMSIVSVICSVSLSCFSIIYMFLA